MHSYDPQQEISWKNRPPYTFLSDEARSDIKAMSVLFGISLDEAIMWVLALTEEIVDNSGS